MTQAKRICSIGAIVFLILLPAALAIQALASPDIASLAPVKARCDQALSQACFFRKGTDETRIPAIVRALAADSVTTQSEIRNALIPSTIRSAEPSLPTTSMTLQPATVSTSSTNGTAGSGGGLSKVIDSIPPYLIIALIPLLFIIGALFYFFFIGDQDRGAPSEEKEADSQFTDEGEDAVWRELK